VRWYLSYTDGISPMGDAAPSHIDYIRQTSRRQSQHHTTDSSRQHSLQQAHRRLPLFRRLSSRTPLRRPGASADRRGHRIDSLVVTNHFSSPHDIVIDWGERRYLSYADGMPPLIRLAGCTTPSSADQHGHRIDNLVVTNHLLIPYDTLKWRARRYLSYADGIPLKIM
jgi:hypothetical protein